MNLQTVARQLGGEVVGQQVVAPGPGHSQKDRSMAVRLSPCAPHGLIVFSHAGDDWRSCRDFVRSRLGIQPTWRPARAKHEGVVASGRSASVKGQIYPLTFPDKQRRARRLWDSALDPHGTIVATYLASRGLDLPTDVAGSVIRFHPECSWREGETIIRVPAMLAAMRAIEADGLTAVHRTRLTADGQKIDRRMLGVAAGSAIKLDADDAVTMGLTIGEGIETGLAARQLGFRPAWALGSVGAIASFPVLAGIEALTILGENDESGASQRAVQECGQRWHDAGREVVVVEAAAGDMNDALLEGA
jgi:putative DNA primase/helicase